MDFFTSAVDPLKNSEKKRLEMQASKRKSDLKREEITGYIETHADILHRILFIYAKLNPSIIYIQGMNEILAVLYYCFLNDTIPNKYHESDLFFTFQNLME
jgi:hypothetical protein